MSAANLLWTAWRGLAANRLRAVLTALGVMIGVAAVIVTLALGNGARAAVDASFRYLGSNQIQLNTKMEFKKGEFKEVGQKLVYREALELPEAAPLAEQVEVTVNRVVKARRGRNVADLTATGTTAEALTSLGSKGQVQPVSWPDGKPLTLEAFLGQGRYFLPAEVLQDAEVCLLAYETADDLFGGEDPLGQMVWVNRRAYTVIGVLTELETVNPAERQYAKPNVGLYLPVGVAIRDLYDEEPAVNVTITVRDPARMDETRQQVAAFLRSKHNIMPAADGSYKDDFAMTTKQDLLGAQQEAARTFSILLTAMAVVSLSVGGIGIMNVMLVSVTERTREIGIRLAVGARRGDITAQFLLEAVLLSAVSGVLGVALGVLAIPLAAILNNGVALLAPDSIPLAFSVALATGVAFGLYPALRAARLNPIEALGYE